MALFLIGVADYVYGRAVRNKILPGTITASQSSIVVPITWVWAQLDGSYAWTPPAFWGIGAAFFTFIGFWSFMRSVELGEASASTPIYRMSFVVTAMLAVWFLGESITLPKTLGLVLTGCAIFLFSDFQRGSFSADKLASVLWAVVAMVAVGLVNFIYKLGVSGGVSPIMFLHSQAVFFITTAYIYSFAVQGGPKFSKKGWAHGLATAICFIFGNTALLAAFREGEATIVSPIVQLSFIVTTILATWRLSEKMTVRKSLGAGRRGGNHHRLHAVTRIADDSLIRPGDARGFREKLWRIPLRRFASGAAHEAPPGVVRPPSRFWRPSRRSTPA